MISFHSRFFTSLIFLMIMHIGIIIYYLIESK